MPPERFYDVAVIGAGPAGLAAAVAASDAGARVTLVEREERPGGILKQCVHDGFGLIRFGEKLSGPEYAYRYLRLAAERELPILTQTFLLALERDAEGYRLRLQNSRQGVFELCAAAVVWAAGCRERTARQVFIHGDRPAGIFTAGMVQYMVNVQGYLPTRRCIILGSGDIGLIMARRLTLEGARVLGVFEIKPEPSGLMRNVVQCLHDFNIPLHLSSTVTRVHGPKRVEGVTVAAVDERLQPIPGTERTIACDALILSVGLIPENDLIESSGLPLDPRTGGPIVDQNLMSCREGLFCCGNALHVNDLVDYVSESGETAGRAAAAYVFTGRRQRELIAVKAGANLLSLVPQQLDRKSGGAVTFYFRSAHTLKNALLTISAGGQILKQKKYLVLRPPEMQRLVFEQAAIPHNAAELAFAITGGGGE
ncbi:MAG: FAD-dependent oxidoreductase [Firmicutes bacterium]|nr:FAD-dependent oxidoreductase [Bacillota bacterium]